MSMNCDGCEYNGFIMLNNKKVSYCKCFRRTKRDMERTNHPSYYPFQHGYCLQKSDEDELKYEDELILKSDVIELADKYYDKFIYESDADEFIVEIESMRDIRSKREEIIKREALDIAIEALKPKQPKGYWIYGNGNGECSICGREKSMGWDNYCGYCGARMRE